MDGVTVGRYVGNIVYVIFLTAIYDAAKKTQPVIIPDASFVPITEGCNDTILEICVGRVMIILVSAQKLSMATWVVVVAVNKTMLGELCFQGILNLD